MDLYEEIVRLRKQGRGCALATIVNTQGSIPSFSSAKMLVRDDGSIVGTVGGGGGEFEVIQAAREVIDQERPRMVSFDLNQRPGIDSGMVCGGSLEIYVEPIVAAPRLYLFGAGHVGLSTYSLRAGRRLRGDGDRRTRGICQPRALPQRPGHRGAPLDEAMAGLEPTAASYILIFTPSHQSDLRVLRWAVGTPARYIGMMGSKRKVTGLFHELQKTGVPAERFGAVHAPVGLDIGAQPPEEIAVAVVAEMISIRRRRAAVLPHLRMQPAQPEVRLREVG